jgi:hypothetical protein
MNIWHDTVDANADRVELAPPTSVLCEGGSSC